VKIKPLFLLLAVPAFAGQMQTAGIKWSIFLLGDINVLEKRLEK
jgi:hypothetical protein